MNRNLFFLILLFFAQFLFSQQLRTKIEGVVKSDSGDVSAVHVLNLSSDKATITNAKGYFSIPVFLNDTLVFSAIQYKKKEIIVSLKIVSSKNTTVYLEDALTELDEVIVMPYNLTGSLSKDLKNMKVTPQVTATSLGFPNTYVKHPTGSERKLFVAQSGGNLLSVINGITGKTKKLKEQVARDRKYARTNRVREFYADSIFTGQLKIPKIKIDDLMRFCEEDQSFQRVIDSHDKIKILEFIRRKSIVYRKNNELD